MEKAFIYDTELGRILIREDREKITGLSLLQKQETNMEAGMLEGQAISQCELCETATIQEAANQLNQYLAGKRKQFTIELMPKGTPFQLKVWKALQEIPYGETRSYGQIATEIGNAKASMAVGMANHNNPIMIFIPCHRVIGADGKLVGFGAGLDLKGRLLKLESASN